MQESNIAGDIRGTREGAVRRGGGEREKGVTREGKHEDQV